MGFPGRPAHQRDQFVIDDLDDLPGGIENFNNLFPSDFSVTLATKSRTTETLTSAS